MSGRKIIDGLHEAIAFLDGDATAARVRTVRVPDEVDVKGIRERLNMSQKQFAVSFGFPLSTVQNWEQGRRKPEGSARILLRLIDDDPSAVERVLSTG